MGFVSMATGTQGSDEIAVIKDSDLITNSKSEYEMQNIVHMLNKLKLNPQAKEFVPSSYNNRDQMFFNNFVTAHKSLGGDGFRNNQRVYLQFF